MRRINDMTTDELIARVRRLDELYVAAQDAADALWASPRKKGRDRLKAAATRAWNKYESLRDEAK